MNSVAENILDNYKTIETICAKNHAVWNSVPEFRGAFSRFSLKVAQLDLIAHDENARKQFMSNPIHSLEKLLRDIEQILKQSFDRYFDYLQKRNNEFYLMYSSVRSQAD